MIRNFMEGFRRGREAKLAEYVRNPWPYEAPAADEAEHEPAGSGDPHRSRVDELESELHARDAELVEKRRLLVDLANFAEQLKARVEELEARPDAAPHQARIEELEGALRAYEAELKEKRRLLADLANLAEQLKTELEARPDDAAAELCADVLRLPGVEKTLRNKFHPDLHPKDRNDEAKWRGWNEATQKINAAYDAIRRKRPPPGA
jgi:hypothetical protein